MYKSQAAAVEVFFNWTELITPAATFSRARTLAVRKPFNHPDPGWAYRNERGAGRVPSLARTEAALGVAREKLLKKLPSSGVEA